MSPYQVMAIIACCTIISAGVVTLLTMQGVNILLAFLVVYLVAVWFMLGMQRRARESFEVREEFETHHHERESLTGRVRASDFQGRSRSERVEQLHV